MQVFKTNIEEEEEEEEVREIACRTAMMRRLEQGGWKH